MKNIFKFLSLLFFAQLCEAQVNPNLIPYRKGNFWGLADYHRTIMVKPTYDYVMIFDKKLNAYQAMQDGKYGLIDDKGKWLIPAISESEIYQRDEHFVIRKPNDLEYYSPKTYQINKNYKSSDYSSAYTSSPKVPYVAKLNAEDEKILKVYSKDRGFNIYNFDEEYVEISKDTTVIKENYQARTSYQYGIYVPKLKKVFLKTKQGHIYQKATCGEESECFLIVKKDDLLGVVDEKEREVLPNIYNEISKYKHHLVLKEGSAYTKNASEDTKEKKSNNQYFSFILKTRKLVEGYLSYSNNEIIYKGEKFKVFNKISKRKVEEKHSAASNKNQIPMTYSSVGNQIEYVNENADWFFED